MARPKKIQAKGLGDTVESVLKATGIDKVAKFILGEDCKCDERKAKLNALFPYKKPLCLTESEYEWLKAWIETKTNQVTPSDQAQILVIYNRIFLQRNEPSNCSSCLKDMVDQLKQVMLTYEDAETEK
jgi:hypothetical protein